MNCSKAEKLLPLAAGGELEAEKLREVEAHVERCPKCRRVAEEYKKLLELARSIPSPETPTGFYEDFLRETVGRTMENAPHTRKSPPSRRRGRRMGYVFAGAAALIVIVVSSVIIALRLQGPQVHQGLTVDMYLTRSDFDGLSEALRNADTRNALMCDSVSVDLLLSTIERLRRAHRLHGHIERHIIRFLCNILTGAPVHVMDSQQIFSPKMRVKICKNGTELKKAIRALRWYRRSGRRIAMTDLIGALSTNPEA